MPPRARRTSPPTSRRHAEWVGLLRSDGPFIAAPVLADAFPQGLDTVPAETLDRLRQAWTEFQAAPDLLAPAWHDLVIHELLRLPRQAVGDAPDELRAWGTGDTGIRPDAIAYGPDGRGGRAERLLIYRRPWDEALTRATKEHTSPVDQAADLCLRRGTPLALVSNGHQYALVHVRPREPRTVAVFDADLWLEERDLLRAFASLFGAGRVLPPPKTADGGHSDSLEALFARSAEAQAEITDTLGEQVRQAVELLIGEIARLDRESGGALLREVEPRDVYRGALTVLMRLVLLLYAEEQRLLPVESDLYASAYSVSGLYDQLGAERERYGYELGDRRTAAWPRLLATILAVYGGCEHDQMRIPPYRGGLFDPGRYPWLIWLNVSDFVVYEVLDALLTLRQPGRAAERLSYRGLGVEQIGHVYEGLLEFSCRRVVEPYVGLFGRLEPEIPLAALERAAAREDFEEWLKSTCAASAAQIRGALAVQPAPAQLGALDAACDNDVDLAARVRPFIGMPKERGGKRTSGYLRLDLRGRPTVFPRNSLIITKVGDRRATGTHYTPRSLAEEIVEHTLAPLCFSPGPAEGAERDEWRAKPAAELLDLKVLDPAMGSGTFLVAACRYLGDRVVEAWERDGVPSGVVDAVGPAADHDDLVLEARRRVAARCLYGVDRDDMAIELAKLEMWLITLAKDKPFTFLDHNLRCGDSLVGLTTERQVVAFHFDPARGKRINARLCGAIDEVIGPLLAKVLRIREEIEAEPVRDARHGDTLSAKLAEAEELTERLRLSADAVCAAALSAAGSTRGRRSSRDDEEEATAADVFDGRLTALAGDVQSVLLGEDGAAEAEHRVRLLVDRWLQGPRAEPIRPFHWILEFPEVMRLGGFNAVVCNPPFMGGQRLTGHLGEDLREYLVRWIADGKRGSADLCSYFLLRGLRLGHPGRVGVIATNTIGQGDTREVGLDQAVAWDWKIFRGDKSRPWPGSSSVEVALIWLGHPDSKENRVLDGKAVPDSTPSLDPESRINGNPERLVANEEQSFQGSIVLGKGFILEPEQAQALIDKDPRNKDVLFPYLNGEDLNQRWDCSASRWVINFHDWPEKKAAQYTECFAIVERTVKPFRAANNRKVYRDNWWQYAEKRPAMLEAIADLDRVLVISLVSKTGLPAFVPTGQVYAHKLGIFATCYSGTLALLSSTYHYCWAWRTSSTLETRLNYSPTDTYEPFPRPPPTERMERVGDELDTFRREVMGRHRFRVDLSLQPRP